MEGNTEHALRGLVERLEAAFNRNDAEGWTAAFAPEARVIDPFGELLDGPFKGARASYHVDHVRRLGEDHALIDVANDIHGIAARGALSVIRGRMRLVCERVGTDWYVLALSGTQI